MPDQPRPRAAPRDPDGRMAAILIAAFAAALLLGGMLGDLNATPRGRAPAVTVGALAPPTTAGASALGRAGTVGKQPTTTAPPLAPPSTVRAPLAPAAPEPRRPSPGHHGQPATTAPPTTAAPPTSSTTPPSSTAPPTSAGTDEPGPGPAPSSSPTSFPPASAPTTGPPPATIPPGGTP